MQSEGIWVPEYWLPSGSNTDCCAQSVQWTHHDLKTHELQGYGRRVVFAAASPFTRTLWQSASGAETKWADANRRNDPQFFFWSVSGVTGVSDAPSNQWAGRGSGPINQRLISVSPDLDLKFFFFPPRQQVRPSVTTVVFICILEVNLKFQNEAQNHDMAFSHLCILCKINAENKYSDIRFWSFFVSNTLLNATKCSDASFRLESLLITSD